MLQAQKLQIEAKFEKSEREIAFLKGENEEKNSLITQVKQNLEQMRHDKQKYEVEINNFRSQIAALKE